jgi:hypothetical protein
MRSNYFQRLRNHAGLGVGSIMSLLLFLAALQNKSALKMGFVLEYACIAASLPWIVILLSNFRKR